MTGENQHPAGSPTAGEPAFLVVGLVRHPHGVKGEVMVEIHTDFPDRLRPRITVFAGLEHHPLIIRSARPHQSGLLLAFEGIESPESAGRLRNQTLCVPSCDRPPLPEGQYYHHQLLGMDVVTDDGSSLGILTNILSTGANDVYLVTGSGGREILLPATVEVVLNVDLARRIIQVHLLPGLIMEEKISTRKPRGTEKKKLSRHTRRTSV